MVAEASLRNSHCAGLAGRPSFLEFSGKSENRASRQKKQRASQYLLSLPNTQGIEEKLWGCQTQEGSQTPWSLWSGEETEEACTWVCRVGATTGSGSLSSSLLSPLDHNGPQSWLWRSPRPASSSFLSGSAHISPLSCSHCCVLTETHYLRTECLQLPLNKFPLLQPLDLFNIFCILPN